MQNTEELLSDIHGDLLNDNSEAAKSLAKTTSNMSVQYSVDVVQKAAQKRDTEIKELRRDLQTFKNFEITLQKGLEEG